MHAKRHPAWLGLIAEVLLCLGLAAPAAGADAPLAGHREAIAHALRSAAEITAAAVVVEARTENEARELAALWTRLGPGGVGPDQLRAGVTAAAAAAARAAAIAEALGRGSGAPGGPAHLLETETHEARAETQPETLGQLTNTVTTRLAGELASARRERLAALEVWLAAESELAALAAVRLELLRARLRADSAAWGAASEHAGPTLGDEPASQDPGTGGMGDAWLEESARLLTHADPAINSQLAAVRAEDAAARAALRQLDREALALTRLADAMDALLEDTGMPARPQIDAHGVLGRASGRLMDRRKQLERARGAARAALALAERSAEVTARRLLDARMDLLELHAERLDELSERLTAQRRALARAARQAWARSLFERRPLALRVPGFDPVSAEARQLPRLLADAATQPGAALLLVPATILVLGWTLWRLGARPPWLAAAGGGLTGLWVLVAALGPAPPLAWLLGRTLALGALLLAVSLWPGSRPRGGGRDGGVGTLRAMTAIGMGAAGLLGMAGWLTLGGLIAAVALSVALAAALVIPRRRASA